MSVCVSYRELPVEQLVLLDRLEALRHPGDLVARLALAQHLAVEDRRIRIACEMAPLGKVFEILCYSLTSQRDVGPRPAQLVGGVAGVVGEVLPGHAAEDQRVAAAAALHVPEETIVSVNFGSSKSREYIPFGNMSSAFF